MFPLAKLANAVRSTAGRSTKHQRVSHPLWRIPGKIVPAMTSPVCAHARFRREALPSSERAYAGQVWYTGANKARRCLSVLKGSHMPEHRVPQWHPLGRLQLLVPVIAVWLALGQVLHAQRNLDQRDND